METALKILKRKTENILNTEIFLYDNYRVIGYLIRCIVA